MAAAELLTEDVDEEVASSELTDVTSEMEG